MDDFKPKALEIQRKATRAGAASSSFMARVRVESNRVLANLLAASTYVEKFDAEAAMIPRGMCITTLVTIDSEMGIDECDSRAPLNMP